MTLLDLFGGHRQLVVSHLMFDPEWDAACPSCSAGVREWSRGILENLHHRDTEQVFVSRAPYETLAAHQRAAGWDIPWYSSHGSSFNADFGVTLDVSGETWTYNYRTEPTWEGATGTQEMPGNSCFLRAPGDDGSDRVFHTYSSYARGAEWFGGGYAYLDLTALGRQEDWEEPKGRADSVRAGIPVFDQVS